MSINKKLRPVESVDEGLVWIPFGFTVNGTSNPTSTTVRGTFVQSVTRASAGKFLVTLKKKVPRHYGGFVNAAVSSDSTDLVGVFDDSLIVSAGTFYVRFKTGTANTDPADATVVRGAVLVRKTTRTRAGAA